MIGVPTDDEVRLANDIANRLYEVSTQLERCRDKRCWTKIASREVLEEIVKNNRSTKFDGRGT